MIKNELPEFPVDDSTLKLLMASVCPWKYGDPDAEKSDLGAFLDFMAEMGGSDPRAVEEVLDPGDPDVPGLAGASISVMRDQLYHPNNVIEALVEEIWRLRALGESR